MKCRRKKERVEIGDVVTIDGCHKNYRPTVRTIEGCNAGVSFFTADKPILFPLAKLTVYRKRTIKRPQ